jgi:hypothetical protein
VHVDLVFETHSTTEDNENGVATGWTRVASPTRVPRRHGN